MPLDNLINRNARRTTITLWVIQGLVAAVFLMSGGMKLFTPADTLATMSPLPIPFLRFIGSVESLGALGLILPGLFRIWTKLTPLAAVGLVLIMSGATVIQLETAPPATAILPLILGVLAAAIVYGRSRLTAR
ncbi:MAG: DoxX family protein [bacterium]